MAIQFKPRSSDDTYVFGGTDTDPNLLTNTVGVAGPFPRYTIGREIMRQDSIVLNQKYTISITGVALITTAASMLVEGKRQEQVQKLMKQLLDNDARFGLLEIVPYGGLSGQKLSFPDARLLSINLPEADEASAGVQNQGYTVSFEANQLYSGTGEVEQKEDIYGVSDVQESWDVSVNDNAYGLEYPDLIGTAYQYRTFNVNHTISATGFDTYVPAGAETSLGAGDGTAQTVKRGWENARDFVEGRSVDTLKAVTTVVEVDGGDSVSTTAGSAPRDMNPLIKNTDYTAEKGVVVGGAKAGGNDGVRPVGNNSKVTPLDLPVEDTATDTLPVPPACPAASVGSKPEGKWNSYNLVRQKTYDISSGGYSINESWVVGHFAATHTIEFSFSGDATAEFNTVDVSVTVNGFENVMTPVYDGVYKGRLDGDKTKYHNALASFKVLQGRIAQAASCFYDDNKIRWGIATSGTASDHLLRSSSRSYTEAHNELDGVITFNTSYDDTKICNKDVLDESISLSYNNEDGGNQIIVLHPIIARADGPIIQDMSTTNERTLSVTVDWVMLKDKRDAKPDGMASVEFYVPKKSGTKTIIEHMYRRSKTESWNPKNGQYNLTVEYVWAEALVLPAASVPDCDVTPACPLGYVWDDVTETCILETP